ncbi:hypothetical protein [Aromatoleum anaerobium]|uniref:Uncharacterized protein n=1 Tax=Aromatoleum anaerobium TaxID=182180 RepID=A0ABX1PNS5_9RHOO|nr:hypothetical protein [Aromatoleum anaerobium]MCK0507895.1 hypothetical protein [Aromatoleum anaerobium]
MALPTRDDLLTLDTAHLGTPFVRIATGTLDTQTLDVAHGGTPFVGTAEAAPSTTNDSSASLPAIIGDGTTPGVSMANTSDASLLALTGSGTAESGLVGHSRNTNGSPLLLQAITGSGAGGPVWSLPAIVASGTGFAGVIATSDQDIALTGSATANPGFTASSAATLEAITGSGSTPPESVQTLPAITGSASALVGHIGHSSVTLAAISGSADGETPIVGRSSLSLPLPVASGAAITANVGSSTATLAAITLAATGFSGALGSSTLTLPVIAGEGTGYVEVIGSSTVTLPAILSSGQAGTVVGATYSAYALNTENRALTTYSGLSIKGLAKFNGVYLAAGPGGLFVLGGDTNAGALINASARLAVTDFGDPKLKRVEAMYVNYRTDGDLTLKVIIDEHEEYDYTLAAAGHATLAAGRTKIGRGAKGAYWQFEIANRDGADFEFDRLSVDPLMTSRKVG